jgi:RimJ/RimL family protein N-acetyltransferase
MQVIAHVSQLGEIEPLRAKYRAEMDCQIIHESIHGRPGWTREYLLERDGQPVGYGSLAIGGPWADKPTLYEFYVERESRMHTFDLFAALLAESNAAAIETQSNGLILPVMLHTFTRNVRAEAILFEDGFQTSIELPRAGFRTSTPEDKEVLQQKNLDEMARWVATWNGEIVGVGGVLFHYNPPYGDVFMEIAEPFRRKGLGAFLVQELKILCRGLRRTPAARCNVDNVASRKTLQRAGFVPCGNLLAGDLA